MNCCAISGVLIHQFDVLDDQNPDAKVTCSGQHARMRKLFSSSPPTAHTFFRVAFSRGRLVLPTAKALAIASPQVL